MHMNRHEYHYRSKAAKVAVMGLGSLLLAGCKTFPEETKQALEQEIKPAAVEIAQRVLATEGVLITEPEHDMTEASYSSSIEEGSRYDIDIKIRGSGLDPANTTAVTIKSYECSEPESASCTPVQEVRLNEVDGFMGNDYWSVETQYYRPLHALASPVRPGDKNMLYIVEEMVREAGFQAGVALGRAPIQE